jgi:predicted small secreted protein
MMKTGRSIIAVVVLGLLAAAVYGCKKEGPMERTGREIDRAAEKTGEKIEQAGDKIKDAVK